MPSNFSLDALPDPVEGYTVDDLWTLLSSHELESEPGSRYEYSNLGVSLLGRLLARTAGTTYEQLVTERVLEPRGMTSTSITLTPDPAERLAPGRRVCCGHAF